MNREKKLVFVYGSLKRGFYNNYYFKDNKLVAKGVKTLNPYIMYPCTEYLFPYLFKSDKKNLGLSVIGELYEVSEDFLEETLDLLEDTQSGRYSRKTTQILLKNGVIANAYIYIASEALLESDEVDILPYSISEWTKELETMGIDAQRYIKKNKELF